MGKTLKKLPEDGKEETLQKLRNKLADRKQQNLRLKRVIKELEKKLDAAGKPTKDSEKWLKKEKQALTQDQKALDKKNKKVNEIDTLKKQLREKFCAKNNSDT